MTLCRTMMVLYVVIWALIGLQGDCIFGQITASSSSTTPSPGTIFAEDFDKNLAAVGQNLYNGLVGVADPVSKILIDTAPQLVHLYAILNGVDIPPALAALGKDIYGRMAVGGNKLLGGAVVLGSSVVEDTMKVGAQALQAQNEIIEAAARAGIDVSGKIADYLVDATKVSGGITSSGLTAAGDGLLVAGAGLDMLSRDISQLLDAVGARLAIAIGSAKQRLDAIMDSDALKLENGMLKFNDKAQENIYTALNLYLKMLNNIQNIFDHMTSTISGASSTSGASTTTSPSAGPSSSGPSGSDRTAISTSSGKAGKSRKD